MKYTECTKLGLILFVLLIAACSDSSDNGGGGQNIPVLDTANPVNFVAATSNEEYTQLADEMWSLLSSATCWDASFVGDPTIGGTPASVDQFQFYGGNQYRHVAFSTTAGLVFLYDIGKYYGYTTAIVDIGGYVDAIAIVDNSTIAYFTKNPSGVPFVIYYGASNQGCL